MQDYSISKEDLARINALSLEPLKAEEVHIRSMYLCSDQVCEADWGQFSPNALKQIAERIVGESVLCGHDKTSLPIGRFYKAEVMERPSAHEGPAENWVRAWFYWLKNTRGSEDLASNIDGGIYREVSISWRFPSAECSICGGNIKVCGHTPGRFYNNRRCTFLIDQIADVLEGSIVYRAADRKACLEGARSRDRTPDAPDHRIIEICRCLSLLDRGRNLLAVYPAGSWLEAILKSLTLRIEPDGVRGESAIPPPDLVLVDLTGHSEKTMARVISEAHRRTRARGSLFCCRLYPLASPAVVDGLDVHVKDLLRLGIHVIRYASVQTDQGLWVAAQGHWEESS